MFKQKTVSSTDTPVQLKSDKHVSEYFSMNCDTRLTFAAKNGRKTFSSSRCKRTESASSSESKNIRQGNQHNDSSCYLSVKKFEVTRSHRESNSQELSKTEETPKITIN